MDLVTKTVLMWLLRWRYKMAKGLHNMLVLTYHVTHGGCLPACRYQPIWNLGTGGKDVIDFVWWAPWARERTGWGLGGDTKVLCYLDWKLVDWRHCDWLFKELERREEPSSRMGMISDFQPSRAWPPGTKHWTRVLCNSVPTQNYTDAWSLCG